MLRYILGDHKEMSLKARQIIDNQVVNVPIEVLCEVVYVLSKVYNIERAEISAAINNFFENTESEIYQRDAVLKGIMLYSEKNLDFVDCILAGYKIVAGAEIYTFDQKLVNLLNQL